MLVSVLIGIMVVIFYYQTQNGGKIPDFNFEPLNYLSRSFFHGSISHLLANMLTLWQLRGLKDDLSINELPKIIIFIWITSSLILYLFHTLLPNTKRPTIGFSGVLFGLIMVSQYLATGSLTEVSTELIINILPQLMIPNVSFWGHLSGILSGLVYLRLRGI